jgi:Ca2+-binding RTX toxin-like protein
MSIRRSTGVAGSIVLSLTVASLGSLALPGQAGAAVKPCFGRTPTIIGTSGPDELLGTSGVDVIAGLSGDDVIVGGGGNDYICGNGGDDVLDGQGGTDSMNGGAGHDLLFGAGSADVLAGGSGDDLLIGEQGNDTYNGGGGFDYVGFPYSNAPVQVDLREEFAAGEGADGVHYVEGVLGSEFADTAFGNAYANAFEGLGGSDTFHGRGGSDAVTYSLSERGVVVDLELGTTEGPDGPDSFASIEDAYGSPRGDQLLGDSGPNYLDGGSGGDTIDGRGGGDTCFGEIVSNCDGAVTGHAADIGLARYAAQLSAHGRGD